MNKSNSPTNLINYRLIIAVILLFVFFAVVFLVLWPNFQSLKISQRENREKRIEVQETEEYFSKLNETRNRLDEYQEEVSKINSALPNEPSIPSLFNYIQKVSSESGLILRETGSFTTSPSEDFSGLQETNLSIEISGSYSSFKNFLLEIERSSRLIKVENVSFSSDEGEDLFVFNLKMKVYSY